MMGKKPNSMVRQRMLQNTEIEHLERMSTCLGTKTETQRAGELVWC